MWWEEVCESYSAMTLTIELVKHYQFDCALLELFKSDITNSIKLSETSENVFLVQTECGADFDRCAVISHEYRAGVAIIAQL